MYKLLSTAIVLLYFNTAIIAQTTPDVEAILAKEYKKLGLSEEDFSDISVRDFHRSSTSNLMHIYVQQQFDGIPIHNAILGLHFIEGGALLHAANNFIPNLKNYTTTKLNPKLSPKEAISIGLKHLGFPKNTGQLSQIESKGSKTTFYHNQSNRQTPIKLVWVPQPNESLSLAWETVLYADKEEEVWQIRIDANSGQVLGKNNWVSSCNFEDHPAPHDPMNIVEADAGAELAAPAPVPPPSFSGQYNIFALPLESPLYGNRSLKTGTDIINSTAAPYGWHDTDADAATIEYDYTRGNHVYAYYAPNGTANIPTATPITRTVGDAYLTGIVPQPAGSSLDFNYTHDLNSANGTDFIEDAVTNLFAWNNICHDVFYLYGFNEAAGNFQETNHTGSGLGEDYVLARAQDGSGLNNARFFTPPEDPMETDRHPIMRMFLWDSDLPTTARDGDFDNLIITHEYGHGVSLRLVGGASTVSCLSNFEQAGEGWSDYLGLMLTMADHNGNGTIDEEILGEGIRGIGSYVQAQSSNGEGIRPAYYTNNMDCDMGTCNDFTYGDVSNLVAPHGVGFLWCTILWDLTLELINTYGFEADIYNTASTAGNIRALKIVLEGLKLTTCDPTFVDMRDAILAANTAIYGGTDNDLLWDVFSRRGLGVNAAANGQESFDEFSMVLTKSVDQSEAAQGETVTYTITVTNNTAASINNVTISDPVPADLSVTSISDGGTLNAGQVVYPTIASIAAGNTVIRTFSGTVSASEFTNTVYENTVETVAPTDFVGAGAWITSVDNPNPNSGSTRSWWHLAPVTSIDASLILTVNLDGSNNNFLSFWHTYDFENGKDGGVIEIFEGSGWVDLDEQFVKNGYDNILLDILVTPIGVPIPQSALSGRRAFSGYSGGYKQTIIDLSTYSGLKQIRFRLATNTGHDVSDCDGTNAGCDGWFLDDFEILDLAHIQNTAFATSVSPSLNVSGNVGTLGTILYAGVLPVELLSFTLSPKEDEIRLNWITASEIDNAGFELQRKTDQDADFSPFAWIKGNGTSNQVNTYQYSDKAVEANTTYYYRLKQVDFDGSFSYSEIRAGRINKSQQGFVVSPNPVADLLNIELNNANTHPFYLDLMNAEGQILLRKQIINSLPSQQLNCSALPAGVYFLRATWPEHVQVEKIIKQ